MATSKNSDFSKFADFFDLTQLKALLVDLDGTLIDSHPSLYNAYSKFMRIHHLHPSLEEFKKLNGPSLPEVVRYLKKTYELKDSLEELYLLYKKELMDPHSRMKIFPQALETLSYLKNSGVLLALVTAAEQEFVDSFIEENTLFHLFDALSFKSNGIKSKPFPDLYENALKRLNIPPYQALAIEDSEAGVISATEAHISTLKIDHDSNPSLSSPRSQVLEVKGGWHVVYQLLTKDR